MNSSKKTPRREKLATASKASAFPPLEIAGESVPPGTRRRLEIPAARLPTGTWLSLPVEVVQGRQPGPRLWISAAVHGDELNGVEIIRQVLNRISPGQIRGALIAVPVVNIFGFIEQSRYLPDRRDLNRSFPGSRRGSLASRLADLFMKEIVGHCSHGIDLHTASHHRINLPQIRANLDDPETRRCALAFAPPIIVHAETRDGSLRQAASSQGIPVLLFEGGEALRFNDEAIAMGVEGILRVMAALRMQTSDRPAKTAKTLASRETVWIRARRGGILRLQTQLGERIKNGQILGAISDALDSESESVRSRFNGLVIGQTNNPLVSQGDAVVHVAIL